MNAILSAGAQLSAQDSRALQTDMMFEDCKWDVQCEDHEVLADFPLILDENAFRELGEIAEGLSRELFDAEEELLCQTQLHSFLGMPNRIRCCLREVNVPPSKAIARVLRFDFHPTKHGWRISEVNADVPGGFIEASGYARRVAHFYSGLDVFAGLGDHYVESLRKIASEAHRHIAFVYGTLHSDDHQVMQYLAGMLRRVGFATSLLSPQHLRWRDGLAEIACAYSTGRPSAVVRFYPAEWLSFLGNSEMWRFYFRGSTTPISNPAYALLVQSKRFPLVWEALKTDLPFWRTYLPKTICPSEMTSFNGDYWVIKPTFGRVGEDVGIENCISRETWNALIKRARTHPKDWVAQERFETLGVPSPVGTVFPCLGVYTIDGKAAGIYGRVATKPLIDQHARDIAVLCRRSSAR
jgi:glutathionylspermidine synthase